MFQKLKEVDHELKRGVYSLLYLYERLGEIEQELQIGYMKIFLIRYVSKA